ncbi:putative specific RNA polymerase II transcription factor [Thermochaetoides thermophila DSM 1495]|uniref:Putative specific RNA polymerase II transcription factor n=1 Tax=Chaetomium thermophilum (strain DSM 1495 / CBS 144.50 / IMI 039719) TaxID=759272 RepID=G0S6K3_CHATD|nr:putative specific RNA polymerase II transcription factor [Thermochaetoides thermophila DSM 1495]EGS20814.1 putative specific RNA polymerase II transcription factor [Thermochaetoides thermophila DSM 1495]
MAHFAAPSLPLQSLSPVSPVPPSSTTSSGGNPAGAAAAAPSTSTRGGPGSGPSPSATTPSQPVQPVQPSSSGSAPTPAQAPQQPHDQQQQQQQQPPQPPPPPPPQQPQPEPPRYRPPNPPQHKRVYQACIPCRRRKVRCDLGSVDDPHDPPCVRCRRESKECFFSATRRKRKADEDDPELEEYILRNGRKQARGASVTLDRRYYSDMPLTPHGRAQSSRRMGDSAKSVRSNSSAGGEFGNGEPNTPLENLEARTVMRREVYGPHDALDLLYKAATDKFNDTSSQKPEDDPAPNHAATHSTSRHLRQESEPRKLSSTTASGGYHSRHASRHETSADNAIDPELTRRDPTSDPGYQEALKAWNRFRFVRAGWFTAQEAIDYIDYYYKYLSPLTPISPPTFQNPASHLTLLTEEPILAVTLLTIASRYRRMPGTGGHCRSHAIHEQLWTYLRGMIERVVWGQEAFGGGFCGSGADENQSSSTAPWRGLRRGSLRTLGTIESLMILTEWHPRALHFPPNEATDELLVPAPDAKPPSDSDGTQKPGGSFGGRRIESWLEPAWRSDRMCWMLLSTAMGLAYELGVFDDIDELLATGAITRPEYEDEAYRLRANRIKRLLLIYLSQLAGRLGWTNMVPEKLRKSDPAISGRKRRASVEGTTPGTNPSSLSNSFNYIPDLELDDQIIHCWAGISHAMQVGNDKLFKSRKHTTEIIQSGKYIELLREFQPMLKNWWNEFERFRLPPYIRHILTIEYEYVRIYINSLSLQAVVERCTSNASGGGGAGGSVSGQSGSTLSPQTQNYYGKLPLGQLGGFGAEDQEYVREVISGSRNLLRTVVDGLLPGEYLKHAPVRTYFRIISGAMFLLKTFALGAPKADVEISIGLMDRTVDALRNCVVDDVHLGIRFADMLETLTSRLRNRFIYAVPPQMPPADGRSPAATNGDGANGNSAASGMTTHLSHVQDMFMKMRDSSGPPERSATPANISATPWDFSAGAFPYPGGPGSVFGPSTPAAATSTTMDNTNNPHGLPADGSSSVTTGSGAGGVIFDSDWANPNNEMWYLPTGPAFFQNIDNTSVSMTAEGVNVGGLDLLEYMAMDPIDNQPFGMDGGGF